MKPSEKFSLNWYDVLKGIIVGAGTGAMMFIQECLSEKDWVFHWNGIAMASVGGILTYLVKNFFSQPPK